MGREREREQKDKFIRWSTYRFQGAPKDLDLPEALQVGDVGHEVEDVAFAVQGQRQQPDVTEDSDLVDGSQVVAAQIGALHLPLLALDPAHPGQEAVDDQALGRGRHRKVSDDAGLLLDGLGRDGLVELGTNHADTFFKACLKSAGHSLKVRYQSFQRGL